MKVSVHHEIVFSNGENRLVKRTKAIFGSLSRTTSWSCETASVEENRMKIGIITCAEHWRDGTSQEPDDQRLLVALGEQARCVRWSDPLTVWSEYDLCVVRSTWDYHKSREAFLSWARTIARVTSLWNPYEVIEWNTDKRYLRELEQQNVPTIPTMWLSAGTTVNLGWYLSHCGWQQAIMKPVVGAGSYGVAFLSQERLAEGQRCLDVLLRNRAVMLQPFYPSVQ